uniref:Vacuolar protein sorting-associated protein 51 homolog n=1 Tax=Aplanochytrium stocchinoi TaxID=215587 RepID=A0A7S3LP82_9STRA
MDRYRTLLENYYGVSGDNRNGESVRVRAAKARDLNSETFDSETYTQELLMNAPLSQLLEEDDRMVHEIRSLDADMQLLVYDNYSKFIGATDTIRKMKHSVEQIEGEIDRLVSKIDSISTHAHQVNQVLEPKRTKIEKLVRLQGLIGKLNFLFELPLKLKECIRADNLSEAVSLYKMAAPILEKYSHVASFAAISRESKNMVKDLERKLNESLTEKSQSPQDFNELIRLVLLMNHQEGTKTQNTSYDYECEFKKFTKELSEKFVDWHTDRLNGVLQSFSERGNNQEYKLNQYVERITSSCLDSLTETCFEYENLFLSKFSESTSQYHNQTISDSVSDDGYETDNEEEDGIDIEMDETQVDDDEAQKQRKLEEAVLRARLGEFAKPILAHYLNEVRRRFDNEPIPSLVDEEFEKSDPVTKTESKYSQILGALQTLLSKLQYIRLNADVMHSGRSLTDRATEIAEHAIRTQVVFAFDALREKVIGRIIEVHQQSMHSKSLDYENVLRISARASEIIKSDIEATMSELRELLATGVMMLSELSAIFNNLVRFQLHHWILWLGNLLECQSSIYHPLRVHMLPVSEVSAMGETEKACGEFYLNSNLNSTSATHLSESRSKILVKMTPLYPIDPSFMLCLACIARDMERTTLDTNLSIAAAQDPDLLKEFDSVQCGLLTAYVDMASEEVSAIMRNDLIFIHSSEAPTQVSSYMETVLIKLFQIRRLIKGCARSENENGSDNERQNKSLSNLNLNVGKYERHEARRNSGFGHIQMDIERIFEKRIETFRQITFDTETIVQAILRIILKNMIECIRVLTLSRYGFQQIQVDVCCIRSIASILVDDASIPSTLVDQTLQTAKERCTDVETLPTSEIEFICRPLKDKVIA